MKISMVWTASTQEAQTPQSTPSVITYSAGFNSIDQAPLETSTTQKNTDLYPSFSPQHWASCLDSTFIYTFHVPSHFYYVSHSTPTSFLFGFSSIFITELELQLFGIFSSCSKLLSGFNFYLHFPCSKSFLLCLPLHSHLVFVWFFFHFYYWVRAPTFQYFQLMQVAGM